MSSTPATKSVKRTTKKSVKVADADPAQVMAAAVKTATPAAAASAAPVVDADAKKERKPTTRRTVNHETVQASITELIESLKAEIEKLGKDKAGAKGRSRGVGVKFLQSTNKKLRIIQADVSRISKPKRQRKANATSNKSSGIMREVQWTPDFCAFLGLPVDTSISRAGVTKRVCDYIAGARFDAQGNRVQGFESKVDANGNVVVGKDGKPVGDESKPRTSKKGEALACASLQNPESRKQIVADAPLKKLFGLETFTYTELQKELGKHIVKTE